MRTEPRAQTPDFEPNYLAAIDFDAPDFPWMLTPAAANVTNAVHKLRPWLVLLVFDREHIDAPRVKAGRPLPSIEIPGAIAATELPDLAESWAWVHTQVSMPQGFIGDLAGELASQPDLNVSRLICPRRLAPECRYLACLVPAFDQGVARGLGGEPDTTQPLGPAWSITTATTVELPVYFHWEFSTGVGGDFEELARKLKPMLPPATLGLSEDLPPSGRAGAHRAHSRATRELHLGRGCTAGIPAEWITATRSRATGRRARHHSAAGLHALPGASG